jgi:hypothetical protein
MSKYTRNFILMLLIATAAGGLTTYFGGYSLAVGVVNGAAIGIAFQLGAASHDR